MAKKTTALATTAQNNLPNIYNATMEDTGVKMEALTLPPMIKPREMPNGSWVTGRLQAVTPSMSKAFKRDEGVKPQNILQFIIEGGKMDGMKYAFPETAVIKNALERIGGAEACIGLLMKITKIGTKPSTKGKKDMNIFEVHVETRNGGKTAKRIAASV